MDDVLSSWGGIDMMIGLGPQMLKGSMTRLKSPAKGPTRTRITKLDLLIGIAVPRSGAQ